ncbi:MAG: GNAT family N-acetyltransferase [Candidatus Odinarchaeia archaeon]
MKGWSLRKFREEDVEAVININRECLPENYPTSFFIDLHHLYPDMFIVAEKNPEEDIKDDPTLLSLLRLIRSKRNQCLSDVEYSAIANIPIEEARKRLEELHKTSEKLPEVFRFIRKEKNNGETVYCVIEDRKIIGYIMCRLESGISNFGFKWVKKGHVVSIAVLEEYRGNKIGEALLREAIAAMEAQGVDEEILEVRTTNYDALRLYEKMGFKIVRTLKGYYRDGHDAYLMARQAVKREENSD